METSVWILILQFVQLLAIIIVGLIYKKQINYMQSKIDTLEKFNKIFDLEKVEKYVSIMQKTSQMEAIHESHKLAESALQENSELRRLIEEKYIETYDEFIGFAFYLFLRVDTKTRTELIKKHFPKNSESLIEFLDTSSKIV